MCVYVWYVYIRVCVCVYVLCIYVCACACVFISVYTCALVVGAVSFGSTCVDGCLCVVFTSVNIRACMRELNNRSSSQRVKTCVPKASHTNSENSRYLTVNGEVVAVSVDDRFPSVVPGLVLEKHVDDLLLQVERSHGVEV